MPQRIAVHTDRKISSVLVHIPGVVINLTHLLCGLMASNVVVDVIYSRVGGLTLLSICVFIACVVVIIGNARAVKRLHDALTPKLIWLLVLGGGEVLTKTMSGAKRQADIVRWLKRQKSPSQQQLARIDFAFETLIKLQSRIERTTVKNWLTNAKIGPDEISPAEAIGDDRFIEVTTSALQFIEVAEGNTFSS
jgi:hypothetical protein